MARVTHAPPRALCPLGTISDMAGARVAAFYLICIAPGLVALALPWMRRARFCDGRVACNSHAEGDKPVHGCPACAALRDQSRAVRRGAMGILVLAAAGALLVEAIGVLIATRNEPGGSDVFAVVVFPILWSIPAAVMGVNWLCAAWTGRITKSDAIAAAAGLATGGPIAWWVASAVDSGHTGGGLMVVGGPGTLLEYGMAWLCVQPLCVIVAWLSKATWVWWRKR